MVFSEENFDMTTKLPAELLSRIFRCFPSLTRSDTPLRSYISSSEEYITLGESTYVLDPTRCPTLFRILLVCHRWRAIALLDSRLWCNFHLGNLPSPLLSFMLEYSRTSPLSFSGPISIPSDMHVAPEVQTILNLVPRIELLHLRFTDPNSSEFSRMIGNLSAASIPTAVLKTLELRIQWTWGASSRDRGSSYALDVSSFPPSLSSITLDGVLPFVPLRHDAITSLHMHSTPVPWKCYLPGGLFDALENLPNLESLRMSQKRQPDLVPRVRPTPRVPPIHLPLLRAFSLSGTPTHYAYFVSSLSIPATALRDIIIYEAAECYDDDTPEGWVPPTSQANAMDETAVNPEVLQDSRDYLLSDLEHMFSTRNLLPDRAGETFQVHFSLLLTQYEEYFLNILVVSTPVHPSGFRTINDPFDTDSANRSVPVLTIKYISPRTMEWDEHSRDLAYPVILPFISAISRMFPPDAVDHLHISSNVLIVQSAKSDLESVHEKSPEWTPSFLEWKKIRSLHVEGKGMAEWIVPHLSETRRLSYKEGGKWRTATSVVVFPKLQELLLDKIDHTYCDQPNPPPYCNRFELWSMQPKSNSLELWKGWEAAIEARAGCEGQKLQGLLLIEWCTWGRLERRDWVATLRSRGWINGGNIRWAADSTFDGDDNLSGYDTDEVEEVFEMYDDPDYLEIEWHRKMCAGLCHAFCNQLSDWD